MAKEWQAARTRAAAASASETFTSAAEIVLECARQASSLSLRWMVLLWLAASVHNTYRRSLICNMDVSITFNYKDLHQAYRHKGVRGEGASLVEKAVR